MESPRRQNWCNPKYFCLVHHSLVGGGRDCAGNICTPMQGGLLAACKIYPNLPKLLICRHHELHGDCGETRGRELAQAQEIQLSGLQRARPSLPHGTFFWCAFMFQTALILPASPYLPASVRHRSKE